MDIYAHLYANYGQVNEGDLEESRLVITAKFESATLPMEQYLFKVRKCQQIHGNALPPRPITDMEAMGISYLNLQRSGLYPLDCREWEMRPLDRKTFQSLQTEFVAAERRLRENRGMGVPQGLANNLEDLQSALEGLTEETAQEREDNTAARARNEALQAAVNALQVQMASVGPGGPAINAMQMQPPPQAHTQPQKQGQSYYNSTSAPPAPPPKSMADTTSDTATTIATAATTTSAVATIPTAGRVSSAKHK